MSTAPLQGVPPLPAANPTISAQNPVLLQTESLIVDLTDYDNAKTYDIYLELGGTLYRICQNVAIISTTTTVNCGPLTNVAIGPDFLSFGPVPAGSDYILFSAEAGLTGGPSKVTAPETINVIPGPQPLIAVDDKFPPNTTIWAVGDIMPVRLLFHDDVTYDYDVKLFNPDKSNEWNIALNHSGSQADVINWMVPNIGDGVCGATDAADCIINSFVAGTSTPVATTPVRINFPLISLSAPANGIAYVRGEAVDIFLLAHTPFRNYNMQIPTGTPTALTSLDTNAVGDTVQPIVWVIPDDCGGAGFPNGMYQMSSHSTNPLNIGALIALSEEFEVFTPSSPGLTVNGGITWPAGSTINIRALRHLTETTHYLEFDGARIPTAAVDDTFITDSCGQAEISYTIPTSTVSGTYTIASFENTSQVQQATVEVEVTNTPDLSISKSGPNTAKAGQPIIYTLTITNNGGAQAANLLITDTIPASASYITGGVKIGNIISWTIPSLTHSGALTQTSFVVTATQDIVNSDYGVLADGSYNAMGTIVVTTKIITGNIDMRTGYLPVIMKQ